MKFAVLNMARAIRVTCVLGAITSVLLFPCSLSSQANFGRILGIVVSRAGGVLSHTTVTLRDKDWAAC